MPRGPTSGSRSTARSLDERSRCGPETDRSDRRCARLHLDEGREAPHSLSPRRSEMDRRLSLLALLLAACAKGDAPAAGASSAGGPHDSAAGSVAVAPADSGGTSSSAAASSPTAGPAAANPTG